MTKKTLMISLLAVLLIAGTVSAKVGLQADRADATRSGQIQAFSVGPYAPEAREAYQGLDLPDRSAVRHSARAVRPVGSALSPNNGIGVGTSVDLTWDDAQYTWGVGRHIASYANESGSIVDIHFAYRADPDTLPDDNENWAGYTNSAYNVYDAVGGTWPRGQDIGCDLEGADDFGYGTMPSMDLLDDGRVILASVGLFFADTLSDGSDYYENWFYIQGSQWNCTYNPQLGNLNLTQIDSSDFQPYWLDQDDGNYSRDPQVVTQWDGSQTVTHVLLGETVMTAMSGADWLNGETYHVITYFRGVGNTAAGHSWQMGETQIIDTVWFVWYSLTAAPYPEQGVAVIYTNPSYWSTQLNQADDNDIYYRESLDRGLTWGTEQNATQFQNAIADDPAHFTCWVEAHGMYSSDGNLHAIFPARPTSADPYFDNYNWNDFDENLYHWDKNSGDMVKIANGVFYNDDMLSGSPNTYHCGFGGANVGYLGWSRLAECDGKLYAIWAQIHERLNLATNHDWGAPENENLMDDCSLAGERLAKANWEILMSVADMTTPSLWDPARNITNTYTPNCCLPGDADPDCASSPCGSEWKPMVDKYGLDYSGLSLTWPDNYVDMTPPGDPAYAGGYFLNLSYLDDQYPGPWVWSDRINPPGTENSIKWVRLACVEPVEASLIKVGPNRIDFPEWAQTGTTTDWTVTVTNEGNVTLNVTTIGAVEDAGGPSGWLSHSVTSYPFTVTAGVTNTNTFDVSADASGISEPTWLDGEVYLLSDAQNFDSISVHLHILAAPHVEPAQWDTVFTDADMFDPYGSPQGECVALAVSNMGEMGWSGAGNVNLDFNLSGNECGPRARDHMYLITASPYVLDADGSGDNVVGTSSNNDVNQADYDGWDPYDDAPVPTPGADQTDELGPGGAYQKVYAGKFVNRDTTMTWERWAYGPRDNADENSFVVMLNKVYSADGQAHANLALGVVNDWDVPAEDPPDNISGSSVSGHFTYMQGTDTTGILSCQTNTTRFGTEAFGGWGSYVDDSCEFSTEIWGQVSLYQMLMEDTNLTRDAQPIDPRAPDYQAWWDDIGANPGFNGYTTVEDQGIWTTYVYDYDLAADDTLYFWSVYSTVRNGTVADLEQQVLYARNWFKETVWGCETGCCVGRVGDANGQGGDEPTIGDISVMIDALFITGGPGPLNCITEADINQSGGKDATYADITIGDISILIDYLFITGPSLGLPDCL